MADGLEVHVTVNREPRVAVVEPRKTLVDFLREDLELTGTHVGCEHGVCGACTVLVDGAAVRSCLMLAVQANDGEVTTIEGLATNGNMSPLQEALWECHSFQCGFCTPGFLMQATELLREHPDADEPLIRETLSGNLCRCTGYESIVDGVLSAVQKLKTT
ncbi:MAG: Carbon-monoxide dehydrogenase (acceptor) [Acidimicrobiales bacterium]|nr:Carbon-monoxide dehydrogenase (acceptor) [Acidimicrobiales bacterium]